MCMPELELDTVWKSEDDMSSENPTSSQPPSDEQQGGFQLLDLITTEIFFFFFFLTKSFPPMKDLEFLTGHVTFKLHNNLI